jgi:ABC-2 type transport system ATP-binding protein
MSLTLTIAGLSKTYPNGVRALSDVSLSIPAGMFGLLGPNGAGKSTLMRTLATLQDADAGTATLGDLDVLRDKAAVRRILGYLPQDFGVYPKVSAEELLDHLARLKGLADNKARRDVVAALLRQTNLYDVRKKALGSFSASRRRCSAIRGSSSSTSQRPGSTRKSVSASTTCSRKSARTSS